MTQAEPGHGAAESWRERVAERSPAVQRSRTRSVERATQIVQAARRLAFEKGTNFTTQELVKEAGVAIQTFYKYFPGKDQVLLAVLEDIISEASADFAARGRELPDPVSRLRYYITSVVTGSLRAGDQVAGPRFITSEHWRLQQLYPDEVARAIGPFTELLIPEIRAAAEAGLIQPVNADNDAWLVTQLSMAVFHHYAFATTEESVEEIGDRLWAFCFAALGGTADPTQGRRRVMRRVR